MSTLHDVTYDVHDIIKAGGILQNTTVGLILDGVQITGDQPYYVDNDRDRDHLARRAVEARTILYDQDTASALERLTRLGVQRRRARTEMLEVTEALHQEVRAARARGVEVPVIVRHSGLSTSQVNNVLGNRRT